MKITDTFRKVETLSIDEVRKWLSEKKEEEFALIDVREPEEYSEGHLPGAELIPLSDLFDRINELDPSKPTILYCRIGNRSRAAAALLKGRGFTEAYNIEGGINAWKGLVAKGAYETGMFLFEDKETAEEFISIALSLEEGTRLFYEKAGEVVNDTEAKQVFSALVEVEEKHKLTLLQTYEQINKIGIQDEFPIKDSLKGFMEGGISMEGVIEWLKDKNRTLQEVLELSMQIEMNSLDLYIKIFHEIDDMNVKKVFNILIDEEKTHLSRLGKLLGSKISS